MHDPITDPHIGDILESYNDLINTHIKRTVVQRVGCQVSFESNGSFYNCCIDVWKVMNKSSKYLGTIFNES